MRTAKNAELVFLKTIQQSKYVLVKRGSGKQLPALQVRKSSIGKTSLDQSWTLAMLTRYTSAPAKLSGKKHVPCSQIWWVHCRPSTNSYLFPFVPNMSERYQFHSISIKVSSTGCFAQRLKSDGEAWQHIFREITIVCVLQELQHEMHLAISTKRLQGDNNCSVRRSNNFLRMVSQMSLWYLGTRTSMECLYIHGHIYIQ